MAVSSPDLDPNDNPIVVIKRLTVEIQGLNGLLRQAVQNPVTTQDVVSALGQVNATGQGQLTGLASLLQGQTVLQNFVADVTAHISQLDTHNQSGNSAVTAALGELKILQGSANTLLGTVKDLLAAKLKIADRNLDALNAGLAFGCASGRLAGVVVGQTLRVLIQNPVNSGRNVRMVSLDNYCAAGVAFGAMVVDPTDQLTGSTVLPVFNRLAGSTNTAKAVVKFSMGTPLSGTASMPIMAMGTGREMKHDFCITPGHSLGISITLGASVDAFFGMFFVEEAI